MVEREVPHPFVRPPTGAEGRTIDGATLRERRSDGASLEVVDVRPSDERRLARLADDRHVPLADLPGRLGDLPRDRPIVVYDHFGGEARRAAALLAQSGFHDIAFLQGGIDDYARNVDPTVGRYATGDESFVLRQLPRPSTGCLAYFIGDPGERTAVLVDPGHEVGPYLQTLKEERWRLAAIVETHTHADHLAGHAALAHATGAPIVVSHRSPAQYPHVGITEGEAVDVGALELVALETPGHTRDHLTLKFAGSIFSGDTLLIGGCGRTDLGDGDPDLLYDSLTEKILALDDATFVYPAHYGPRHALADRFVSTLGVERATNEALRQGGRAAFLQYMTEGWPPKPANFDQLVAANLAPFPP